MGTKFSSSDDEPISEINVVPLVDIILVVLIIFMVTAPMFLKPSIAVNLPKATSGDESKPTPFSISVLRDGKIMLNGVAIDEAGLSAEAGRLVGEKPDLQALIAADQEVAHGIVVRVIDLVKAAGVKKFAISIDKVAQ